MPQETDKRNLVLTPWTAVCAMCQKRVPEGKFVYGHKHPLAPDNHYCLVCAKALFIKDSKEEYEGTK